MKIELENQIMRKYPELFPRGKNVNPQESLIYFGFECDDGWYDLIDRTCAKLQKLIDQGFRVTPVQVKEKYGELRFYISTNNEEAWDITEDAERESKTICEICGKPGSIHGRHWVKCLCNEHHVLGMEVE